MWKIVLLALCVGGCGGAVLQQLQEDLEALKQRQAAREEIKIHIANAPEPVTKSAQRSEPTDPHVTVAVPPCPPPSESLLKRMLLKKVSGRKPHRKR